MTPRTPVRAFRLLCEVLRTGLATEFSGEPEAVLLHRASGRLLPRIGVRVEIGGPVPRSGLLVSNHLSYLDILVIGSVAPARFVAKSDVRSWPIFGWLALRLGTIFVDRKRPMGAPGSVRQIGEALEDGGLVVLFPEGTSSGGHTVLPFKSALLEAGVDRPVHAVRIDYTLAPGGGDPAEEVCYWKDMSFGPHLLRLLGRTEIRARLSFAPEPEMAGDRKELARRLHAIVLALPPERSAHAYFDVSCLGDSERVMGAVPEADLNDSSH